MFRFM